MFVNTEKQIKSLGLKATKARLAILDYLAKSARHLTVFEIKQHLKRSKIKVDEATVYRILKTFCNYNLVKRVQFQEGKFRYEYAKTPLHCHIICTKCGKIEIVKEYVVKFKKSQIEKLAGFKLNFHEIDFFGLCYKCQRR